MNDLARKGIAVAVVSLEGLRLNDGDSQDIIKLCILDHHGLWQSIMQRVALMSLGNYVPSLSEWSS